MPLDITSFRVYQGGNPDLIKESQRRRYASVEIVDEIIAHDEAWRHLTGSIDDLKKRRNQIQKEVATKKKAGEPCDDMVAEIKAIGDQVTATETQQAEEKVVVDRLLSKVGNLVEDSVPVGNNEDVDNRVERTWGTPRNPEGLLNHHDLLWRIGGYEPDRGVNVAGHRGYFLRDVGVLLNQAFINYGIAFLRARNYTVLQPPYMMKKDVMAGVAQLEQFDEELYKVGGDGDDKYLIATSEQPICGYHMGEWIEEKSLPIRYSGISTCFRKEAGSHGKDTWGIFRVHQFEKVEQFVLCEGDLEKSKLMQEEMIKTAEEFYQSLGFPYHVINIASGALNNAAIKKLDLEAWFPGYNSYRELVSCSNCTDYQSRSMEIRCGGKKMEQREKKYVHMLNATLCATGRAICCLLENYQEKDGVRIPEVLVPFMGGMTFMPFVRESKLALPAAVGAAAKAPAGDKKKEEKEKKIAEPVAAASAPAPATAAVAAAPADPLEAAIAAKGDEVRSAKAAKASKEQIDALVAELTALKLEYTAKTGKAIGGQPAPATEKKEKAAKKVEAKVEPPAAPVPATSAPAPAAVHAPVVKPAYTSPAPVVRVTNIPAPSSATAVTVDDLKTLDSRLRLFSYIGGHLPSAEDNQVLAAITAGGNSGDAGSLVNLQRWLKHVQSIPADVRATWR